MTALLDIRDLSLSIATDDGPLSILDCVSLSVAPGQALGVVGESGAGKSTLVRAILGLLPAQARIKSGEVWFAGADLLALPERTLANQIRGRQIALVPQDPYLALNPVFTVGDQLREVLRRRPAPNEPRLTRRQQTDILVALLERLRLPDPAKALDRYPHQFSGGQRQRLLVAAALACKPRLIIADEPTTALDLGTQQEALELLRDLSREDGAALVLVSHDIGLIAEVCDVVQVMYAGQTVETGPTADVLAAPRHPYTAALLACHPSVKGPLRGIAGALPSLAHPPIGCRFSPRCALAGPPCADPPLVRTAGGGAYRCVRVT